MNDYNSNIPNVKINSGNVSHVRGIVVSLYLLMVKYKRVLFVVRGIVKMFVLRFNFFKVASLRFTSWSSGVTLTAWRNLSTLSWYIVGRLISSSNVRSSFFLRGLKVNLSLGSGQRFVIFLVHQLS